MRKRNRALRKPKNALDNKAGKKGSQWRKATRNKPSLEPLASRTATKDRQQPVDPFAGLLPERTEEEGVKRGRPTIRDNFLLGSRDAWLRFLEECWPVVGWPLLEIRSRESSAIEDVQRAFAPLAGKDSFYLARVFSRGSPQPVAARELRANRIRASNLHGAIQEMNSKRRKLEFACMEAESALREANPDNRAIIEKKAEGRKARLLEHDETLRRAESESKTLDAKVPGQETYWYCSQLLDFLRKGKYAVEPLKVANALAGLPQMGWYESVARCSKMPRDHYVPFPYRVFQVVSRMWRRRPKELPSGSTEYFKVQILKLPKRDDGTRLALCRGWRDLRLAIEECWTAGHAEDFMPYAITAAFIRNKERQKAAAERILEESEMLASSQS